MSICQINPLLFLFTQHYKSILRGGDFERMQMYRSSNHGGENQEVIYHLGARGEADDEEFVDFFSDR